MARWNRGRTESQEEGGVAERRQHTAGADSSVLRGVKFASLAECRVVNVAAPFVNVDVGKAALQHQALKSAILSQPSQPSQFSIVLLICKKSWMGLMDLHCVCVFWFFFLPEVWHQAKSPIS